LTVSSTIDICRSANDRGRLYKTVPSGTGTVWDKTAQMFQ
jgi:hypothetical protein